MEAKLNAEEINALRLALSAIVIKERTGEFGILHGMDRFVSAQVILKKPARAALDSVMRKTGAASITRYDG